MSRRNLILVLVFYIVLVLGLNMWHTNYFTAPGMGFTTESLLIKYIVDYSSLIQIGFFPLFLFFKIFSIYGLLLLILLIYKAPTIFLQSSEKTLYFILFATLLFISTYNTLNYRYHLTLYPLLIYFVAIELDSIQKKMMKYALSILVAITCILSYQSVRPFMKMILRSSNRAQLLDSDQLQRQTCGAIQKLQQETNRSVITFGTSTLESFCTFKYMKFEGSQLDTEASLVKQLTNILKNKKEILLIGRTKKSIKLLSVFLPVEKEYFKNDIYSIYTPGIE